MRFSLVTLLSLSAVALALPSPEPATAPTCGRDSDCNSFCSGGPCKTGFCGASAFGDQRCFCGGCPSV
ncbi:hypothetical protein C8035_v004786 [Colletotrichum spinosum]|uniref:Uncharacterized protein n=1 Tax=Colletotrichum spinosum TaxID=1347390 RepID=A0A4R8QI19_9PEZI|nr:hypothetical protein C8035_v004786 [Colletotrichum spinosum]